MSVRRTTDEYLEVPAELGDGSGFATGPIQLRPGTADDSLRINFAPGEPGREIRIYDLRVGIDAVEKETW